MKRTLIIGGGFSGISAAEVLSRCRKELEVTIVDPKESFEFLPLLPDLIGGRVSAGTIGVKFSEIAKKFGFEYVRDEVREIVLKERKVISASRRWEYDYLIISAGSQTNFYGNEEARAGGFKLDNISDAVLLRQKVLSSDTDNFLICGGGYTGVETAVNIRLALKRRKFKKRIIILEKSDKLVPALPDRMKRYISENLKAAGIEIMLSDGIKRVSKDSLETESGLILQNAVLVWTAGVKVPDFIKSLDRQYDRQQRIIVSEDLSIDENCFCAGDTAHVESGKMPLRMAAQFSIYEGRIAAQNVLNSLYGRRRKIFRPLDLGYIVPLADNRACGKVLGINVQGGVALFFHYFMCLYRLYGGRHKLDMIREIFS